ncbi:MAG: UDP-galactopyranose mutase [Lachnospiraceae bacterium]|nr:UDP-galactopyranose mutase [Lachnospiraceae bacterium]
MNYDYLIVGAGLYGCVFAHEAYKAGKRCLVIDKRDHIGGNIYTENTAGINVHKYGAHIFHTSNKEVWDYVCSFADFNNYVNSPVAVYKDELYNLPFNMNTFHELWGVKTPQEARRRLDEQIAKDKKEEPANLEEQALNLVGRDIYEKLIKGYTEKQWGRDCKDLPAFIIKRLPVRFRYDNNYFNDRYQGIPVGGYTLIAKKMLEGTEVRLNSSYEDFIKANEKKGAGADSFSKVVYTGMIDEYFGYKLGKLEYRTLKFETKLLEGVDNFQGNAVVNYTERQIPYTRVIEHKHFEFTECPDTVITYEYPKEFVEGDEPYYPVNNDRNSELFGEYLKLAEEEDNVIFGGRLGAYRYYDMDKVIEAALARVREELA